MKWGDSLRILVTGGAGYIGSHFCALASRRGHHVVIYDDFSSGNSWACGSLQVIEGDILDTEKLARYTYGCDVVCHFAGKISVSESGTNSNEYFRVNTEGTGSVLDAMTESQCNRVIFSSTAAVYQPPVCGYKISEADSCHPINVYGVSKLRAEHQVNLWASENPDRSGVIFRYFNAAGAFPDYRLGEYHTPETHLIPNILNSLLCSADQPFSLFGVDYPTKDGTCIRDYIHVGDIASAHLAALDFDQKGCIRMNLGSGRGYSNLEVIAHCESITNRHLNYEVLGRRLGDPSYLVTDNSLAMNLLRWRPRASTMSQIVHDAIAWHYRVAPLVVVSD